jgi:signal peptidase I
MKRISAFLSLLVLLLLSSGSRHAYADTASADCGQDSQSQVNALVKIPASNPDIYLRAGLTEDQVPSQLYFQPIGDPNAPCTNLGSLTLTADWQKISTAPSTVFDTPGILTLALSGMAPNNGASTPQALFASPKPPCELGTGCMVAYQGVKLDLSPKKVSSAVDTLHAGVLTDPAADTIKEVIYSVDGIQVYTKKTLQPFNESFVAGGEHSVERTVVLSSGQSLSDKRQVQKGSIANINYLAVSLFNRYLKYVIFVGSIVGLLLFWLLLLSITKLIYKRHEWRRTHILSTKPVAFDRSKVGPQDSRMFQDSPLDVMKNHKKAFIIPLSFIVLLFVAYSFVITSFTVDGLSMYPTLHDKSHQPLFILPAELGKVTGNGYTPKRGSIVVIEKDENNLFNDSAIQQKSYVVKRVIGLPEERVVVSNGKVTVYNKQYPNGFVPDDTFHWLKIAPQAEYGRLDVTLKQGELFVMGDNRDNSIDSRSYGPVKTTQVIGRVL